MKNTIIKKVALFDPYLDTIGGGEKHILSILSVFAAHGYQVDVLWDDPHVLRTVKERLNIHHDNFHVVPNFMKQNMISKFFQPDRYDCFFYVTDGSYFFSKVKKNYVFCMYPDRKLFHMNLINRIKVSNFQFFANSQFSARYISQWTNRPVEVLYPYVDDVFSSRTKKNPIILSVGRFFEHLHTKRHDVIITAFKQLKEKVKKAQGYQLIIAGALQKGEEASLQKLEKLASGEGAISFVVNPDFEKLVSLYQSADIYWHAAGYGVDEESEQYKVEHLGLTPLEAMAAGCITFAHNSGGPRETLPPGGGVLYDDIDGLVEKTKKFMNNSEEIHKLREKGQHYIRENFSYRVFQKNVIEYFAL